MGVTLWLISCLVAATSWICDAAADGIVDGTIPKTIGTLACGNGEKKASVDFHFPRQGQELDVNWDLSLGLNLLVRFSIRDFKMKTDGKIVLALSSYGRNELGAAMAPIDIEVEDKLAKMRPESWASRFRAIMVVDSANFELLGVAEGNYTLHAWLVDHNDNTRSCWRSAYISFSVIHNNPTNRSESLLGALRSQEAWGGRTGARQAPWLRQPNNLHDFAYVTVIWSDDYVDNVLAWAGGLVAVGSTFRRVCMLVESKLRAEFVQLLRRCCCDILPISPIPAPWRALKGEWNRYELALTKLRVLQLGRFGLRKVVLMDSDILVLQNIDELFWMPAPAATVSAATLLGATKVPKLSTGVMVLEPDEGEFNAVMDRLHEWESKAGSKDVLRFIEQDLLDMHWLADGHMKYHVLPLIYNLYPELLDVFPFLSPENASHSTSQLYQMPLDHGVKIVHLWHWYNPMLMTLQSARQTLQTNAKVKHNQMWIWYELWWKLHQDALAVGVAEKYPLWVQACTDQLVKKYGSDLAGYFVPTARGNCFHKYGGLAW